MDRGLAQRVIFYTWVLALLFSSIIFAYDFGGFSRHAGLSINGEALWGRDFANVYSAGQLTLQHGLTQLYDIKAYQAWQSDWFGGGIKNHNYSYPPVTLLYTWVFALVPYGVALGLWLFGTGAAFYCAARPYLQRAGLSPWLAIASPATIGCIWAGHYGMLLGALWLGAWHFLPRRPKLAGVLIGLMIIKPHLAILIPLVLLRRRAWVTIVTAAITVTGLILASVIIFGPELWRIYLTQTTAVQADMIGHADTLYSVMMPTTAPALLRLGFSLSGALIIQAIVAVLSAAALWRWLPADPYVACFATAVATFLVLPYGFFYDMTIIGIAVIILLYQIQNDTPRWQMAIITLACLLPVMIIIINHFRIPAGPILMAGILTVLLRQPLFPEKNNPKKLTVADG